MFAKVLTTDKWEDRNDLGISTNSPSWDQIAQAIVSLDGESKTTAVLLGNPDSASCMIIAGTWDNRCMVNATRDGKEFWSLVDPAGSKNKRILYVGGQNGDYEERMLIPLEVALEAAQTFYEKGELKSTLNWQSDY
jgi:Immunity protein Imm1